MTRTITHSPFIERIHVDGKPLGRGLLHDSASRAYPVNRKAAVAASKAWQRHSPVLNQGNIGSCTGNASDGCLGSDPFYSTLPSDFDFAEDTAVKIYSLATKLDSFSGEYPPTDTGSNGLSAAKACQQLGFISGYEHAFSVDDVIAGLQTRPGITGVNWYEGMDTPDENGFVAPTGRVRGGHEFEIAAVDMENEYFGFWNSWGTGYGDQGRMRIRFSDYERLLSEDGDATFFTPLSQPAPTPIVAVTQLNIADDIAEHVARAAARHDFPNVDSWADNHFRHWFRV